jgi:hypothetical protein
VATDIKFVLVATGFDADHLATLAVAGVSATRRSLAARTHDRFDAGVHDRRQND